MNKVRGISFDALTALYEDSTKYDLVEDPHLRMQVGPGSLGPVPIGVAAGWAMPTLCPCIDGLVTH